MTKIILAITLLFTLVSCKNKDIKSLEKDFTKMRHQLKKSQQGSYPAAVKLKNLNKELLLAVYKKPKLKGELTQDSQEARQFIEDNQANLALWFETVESKREQLHQLILEISKDSYEKGERGEFNKKLAENEILTFYALMFLNEANRVFLQSLLPMSLIASNKVFESDVMIQEFRATITKKYLAQVTYSKVVENDLQTEVENLTVLRSQKLIGSAQSKILSQTISRKLEGVKTKQERVSKLKQSFDESQLAYFNKVQEMYTKSQSQFSLLYNPEHELSNPLLKLMVVISNLTWGGINSVIGAGATLVAIVGSPFTPYLDFPEIRIADNGIQIFVDVSGLTPFAGKMSLGIFELSNGGGYSWASGHEGGHSVQSAILGPFYLPTIVASYAIEGYWNSSMERLADIWSVE